MQLRFDGLSANTQCPNTNAMMNVFAKSLAEHSKLGSKIQPLARWEGYIGNSRYPQLFSVHSGFRVEAALVGS